MFDVHTPTAIKTLIPNDVTAATLTGLPVDVRPLVGNGKLILDAEAQGSGITNTVKIQESAKPAAGALFATAGDADLKLNLVTSGKTKQAVTFTQSGGGAVKHIDLVLKKTGTIVGTKILTLTLNANSAGDPGSVLGTAATVLANSIGTSYETVRFTFATPVNITDTTVYWIVLESDYDASDSNYISWSVFTVVSGGTVSGFAPSTWTAVTTQKALFTVYQFVFTDISGAAFSAVGNTAATLTLGLNLDSVKQYIRAIATVAGGSSVGAVSLTLIGRSPNV